MGFVSMDSTYIEILQRSGTSAQKHQAARVKPFVLRHHLTLVRDDFFWRATQVAWISFHDMYLSTQVTLLLANSAANEALPLITDRLLPPWAAVVLSVTLVLLFAEILPSSIFTGPSQLRIASNLTPLMWIVVILFYPVAAPIAALLDYCLGHDHGLRFQRHELKEFIKLHAATSAAGAANDTNGSVQSAPAPLVRAGSSKALQGGSSQALLPPQSVNMGSGSMLRALSDPALSEGGEGGLAVSTGVTDGVPASNQEGGTSIVRQTSLPDARLIARARGAQGGYVEPWDSRQGATVSHDDMSLARTPSRGGVVYGVHRVKGRDLHANLAHIASRGAQFLSATNEGGLSEGDGRIPPPAAGGGLTPLGRSASTPSGGGSAPTAAMLVLAKNTASNLKKHKRQRSGNASLRGAAHSTPTSNGGGIMVKDSVYVPAELAQTGAAALRAPLLEGGPEEDLEGGQTGQLEDIPEGDTSDGEGDDGETHMESHMLSLDEITIISSTLDLKDKTVMYRAIPAEKVFMLSTQDVLSAEMVCRCCSLFVFAAPPFTPLAMRR